MSVRWFRVVTALTLASALSAAAIMPSTAGRLGSGVLFLLIAAAAVRLTWTAARSMNQVIADVDAEPHLYDPKRRL